MYSVHDFEGRVEKAELLLEKSGISDVNKDLIRCFCDFKTATKVKLPRIAKYIGTLRIIAERYLNDRDFTDISKKGIISIVAKIERSNLSDWTKHDYLVIIKTFFKYLEKDDLVSWIRPGNPGTTTQPEDLLSEGDILAMIDAASSTRDKALIACIYEGALRVGEVGGLRIRDVSLHRLCAKVRVNGKTGPRAVTLIFAAPYIAQWLGMHPFRGDRNAPLWTCGGVGRSPTGMKYGALRQQIRRIAERANVNAKCNLHNFRHTRGTHLALRITELQLKQYLGLSPNSKMAAVYVHMSGRDIDRDLLRLYGLQPMEEREPLLKPVQCPDCGALNTLDAPVCASCRTSLAVEVEG